MSDRTCITCTKEKDEIRATMTDKNNELFRGWDHLCTKCLERKTKKRLEAEEPEMQRARKRRKAKRGGGPGWLH